MFKDVYKVVGVMSGTSLDGVDCAYIQLSLSPDGNWDYNFLKTTTFEYDHQWQDRLRDCSLLEVGEVKQLEDDFTQHLIDILREFIGQLNGRPDAICSHGHTVWHRPELGYTRQIGDGQVLATALQLPVVCDFRTQDVALGGQGAPLVPIGDRLLFHDYEYCLNLGGFANCSMENDGQRLAYDICPVNIVLNRYAQKLGYPYDDKGRLAASGNVNESLLTRLNNLAYYQLSPPKSLGVEWVSEQIDPILVETDLPHCDMLRTLVEHMAEQIAGSIPVKSKVLITGGGAYNDFLIRRIREECEAEITIPQANLIEHKEALIFGLLGVLRFRNEVNCLASVTGAKKNHSSGKIFHP
ncbi:anhydro-N-acetylmuramic acid kinase [Aureitalea marina]|uniref:Anhydro-N-acetylmuramic acid kinase n=1 Tax=Aureitalea marina TaxID=930804 RepID=A0A2S7KQU3_9FLAO|nr:anhydro-N-acetylmuramic acid kinase [Aureitalea marina]PQB04999.1 anhydro-N-acetylmuramic acid kinase [Aureitalea marina]